jgi:HEAT repeat protein
MCEGQKVIKKLMLLLVLFVCMMQEVDFVCAASTRIESLAESVRTAKDRTEKFKLKNNLARCVPMNKEEMEEMLKLVDDEDEFVREGARKASMDVKDPSLAPVFRKRLRKGKFAEQTIAISKAAQFKDKEAVPDLIEMVKEYNSKNEEIALIGIYSGQALGEIGDERGIPVLLSKLGKMNAHEAQMIARYGKKVLPQLAEIIKTSGNEEEKAEAGNAIGMIKDKEAIPDLWKILKEEKATRLRTSAAYSLMTMLDEKTKPTYSELNKYLYGEAKNDKEVFGLGRTSLVLAMKNRDINYLLKVAEDTKNTSSNRENAIVCLGDLKAQEAVPVLLKILNEHKKNISSLAAESLEQITGNKYEWRAK